ncbi:MAG TPA: hypothetical protein VGM88_22305 [Kofleriaceae bacterium]|jgi:hypothetical protein
MDRLATLRLGFRCTQRWEDMAGDDRVRACAGCNRDVFNLSAMTRDEAEALLASRGVTPCVRFYRRPDGTVMTSDCPTAAPRRLAAVASSLAAGAALAVSSPASADPVPDATSDAAPAPHAMLHIDDEPHLTGIPVPERTFEEPIQELGVIVVRADPADRPKVEWSVWGRLGFGVGARQPASLARTITPPPLTDSYAASDLALSGEVTFGVARDGDLRAGVWTELRTSTDPVAGGELVIEGLPPHPFDSRIDGRGSIVLRGGLNAHVVTGALGFGYVGSWPRSDPWLRWARHVVGARLVVSANRSLDDPRVWSATLGVEVELPGAVHAIYRVLR